MSQGMERIKCSDVTDTLLKAMEHADDMEDVLVLYYAKKGRKGCYLGSEGMKASDMLWVIEQFKAWLLGLAHRENWTDGEDED